MSGVILALAASSAPSVAGGAAPVPSALNWIDVYGTDTASTQTLVVSGIGAPVTLSARPTGTAVLGYALNGNPMLYAGAFVAHPGDALSWFLSIPTTRTAGAAGTVTVTNVSAGADLDSFAYVLNSSRGPIP